jgi:DNA repair and recombination protein RAD54 and RAD54-like protein
MARRKNVRSPLLPSARGCLFNGSCVGFVYRFISTGTIEEKIFQRQASKQALSSAVVDEKEDAERHFSIDALRKLFLFNEHTMCETHETFKCKRCKHGKQIIKAPALLYGDASTYVFQFFSHFEDT